MSFATVCTEEMQKGGGGDAEGQVAENNDRKSVITSVDLQ